MSDSNPDQPQFQAAICTNPPGMSDAQALQGIENCIFPSGFKVLSKSTYTLNGTSAYGIIYTINNKDYTPK